MDGECRHLETRAAPLRNDDGTVAQLGVARDITTRKQAEARLRESECNLRQLTETIPVMLWSATPEGAIDYCNAGSLSTPVSTPTRSWEVRIYCASSSR